MVCYELLKQKYNLSGYSPDTILTLMKESLTPDECESLFAYLQARYG
ncbi:hypothetical protein [Sulfolobus monocaudavirus SMV4]|nr:hypothetical protein AVT99_gp62 [Sulfolobus monocaudavirus SMV4]ALG97086.1 hypothetical protein [Sulfolobus monocaudavirus SMV4]